MKSANIPSLFVETESGSMEFLNSDKENEEPGYIRIVEEDGSMAYGGRLSSISGRGNTTWDYHKKPYKIKLDQQASLLGMDKGKSWYLLPIWREGNRMNTKVVMDIATELGLAFTPECMWVDIYFNGEYAGNYLLCESVTVADGRVAIYDLEKQNEALNPDIDTMPVFWNEAGKGYELDYGDNVEGGYLVEKDTEDYYERSRSGFKTKAGWCFTIKGPSHASREQVDYIRNYFQTIEDMIINGTPDYERYIDLDSFAARFLVDEISLNIDANVTSMYFYKKRNSDLLYAGPVWDYDSSMGESNAGWCEGKYVDYTQSILNPFREDEELNWYRKLYEDEQFYDQVIAEYQKILPFMKDMLENKIDGYAAMIRASAKMDAVRWQNEDVSGDKPGHYMTFDNNVRYLKYFLANRLNYLCEKWQISFAVFEIAGNGNSHEVTFVCEDNVVEIRTVQDGNTMEDLPYLDEEKYWGWYFVTSVEKYRNTIPIYEDCVLYARLK